MSIYKPYFYIIQEMSTGIYYAGCRYSKKSNPKELLAEGGYFTSSRVVSDIIKRSGIKSFRIRKIKIFNTKEDVLNYEKRFLLCVNAATNQTFYNKHNGDLRFSFYDDAYKAAMVKRYGTENVSASLEIKKKKRDTSIKNWGTESPTQSVWVKEKTKVTNETIYGGVAPACSKDVKQKMQDTCMGRYGVRNPYQSEEIKEKIKKRNVVKYGVEHPQQLDEVKIKIRERCMAKFGYNTPLENPDIKAKMVNTFNLLKQRENVKLLYRYRDELGAKIPHWFYRKDDDWVSNLLEECIEKHGELYV